MLKILINNIDKCHFMDLEVHGLHNFYNWKNCLIDIDLIKTTGKNYAYEEMKNSYRLI
jgi:hypothetical protein